MSLRVRFAPSPTGSLHIGTVRTALFNWIVAQKYKGTFILRIEDTDLARSDRKYEESIIDGMQWLRLTWDEGPANGGAYGPYRQSERIADHIYQRYAQQLLDEKKAYYCFCTDAELDQERQAAESAHQPYVYSRKCQHLSPDEIQAKIQAKIPYAVRFLVDSEAQIVINDKIRGEISFDPKLISDFIMIKSDQTPSYNFAVVVDDFLMKVTDVIRGEDHISNTARQILLFNALGAPIPHFAHMPMILGADRAKLSKRHGATSVIQYQEMGYLADAFFNYLTLLGWTPPNGKEILTREEIIAQFQVEKINKSNAIFDIQKLNWMNGQYIRKLTKDQLYDAVSPYFSADMHHLLQARYSAADIKNMAWSVRDNLVVLTDIQSYLQVYLDSFEQYKTAVSEQNFTDEALSVLRLFLDAVAKAPDELTSDAYMQVFKDIQTATGLGGGKVFKPIRQAVTGSLVGPHIADFCCIVGKKTIIERLLFILNMDQRTI